MGSANATGAANKGRQAADHADNVWLETQMQHQPACSLPRGTLDRKWLRGAAGCRQSLEKYSGRQAADKVWLETKMQHQPARSLPRETRDRKWLRGAADKVWKSIAADNLPTRSG